MTTFKRLRPNISNHKILIAGLNSVTSTLLLLGAPSLLTKVQDIKVFWSPGIIKDSHYADFILQFHNSPVATEWAGKGLWVSGGRTSSQISKCSATYVRQHQHLLWATQESKPVSHAQVKMMKRLSSYLNTLETIRLVIQYLEV